MNTKNMAAGALSSISDTINRMDKKILIVLILILLAIVFQGTPRIILILILMFYLAAWKLFIGFFKE